MTASTASGDRGGAPAAIRRRARKRLPAHLNCDTGGPGGELEIQKHPPLTFTLNQTRQNEAQTELKCRRGWPPLRVKPDRSVRTPPGLPRLPLKTSPRVDNSRVIAANRQLITLSMSTAPSCRQPPPARGVNSSLLNASFLCFFF